MSADDAPTCSSTGSANVAAGIHPSYRYARHHEEKTEAMADSSFDVVSKIDRQEADNALNQAAKELSQRFDFRGTNASIEWSGDLGITIKADTEAKRLQDEFYAGSETPF